MHAPESASTLLPAAGRVVAISGAGRGLGAAIARRLHADGFTLSLGVRDPAAARARLALADRAAFHRFDANEPPTAAAWIDATLAAHGRLDALVNNAGILKMMNFDTGSEEDLDELFAVNVKGPFRLTRLALPHLIASGHGRLINIASTDGKRIRDRSVSLGYAMTKHALVAMSHAARWAGWENGLRVTALCPGAIDTDLVAGLPGATPTADRLKPETIAELVSLLMRLPNQATIAELVVNTRLEATL